MRKEASADSGSSFLHARNSSRDFATDSQATLIVKSVIKWHEFRGIEKIATILIHARLTQCSNQSRTGKNPLFLIYSSRFLDGFEQLLARGTFRTTAHTAKM